MPGLLITTSQRINASSPPAPVARTSTPSSAGATGASSTSTASRPMECNRRTLACPSTPSPQTPTDASASADQEIGRRIAIRNSMRAPRLQQGGGVGGREVPEFGGQARREFGAGAVRSLRRQHEGGPALVGVPDTLERLDAHAQAQQGPEALLVAPVLQGLVAGEHGLEFHAVHERGEDEVDETTLVAAAAPVVEPPRGVLVEGAIATAKGAVVRRETGELLRPPQLGARAEVGEHRDPRSQRREDEVAERLLKALALGPLVVHGEPFGHEGGHGGGPLVGQHD